MRAADYLVDVGPGAGNHGGEIVSSGTLKGNERQEILNRSILER